MSNSPLTLIQLYLDEVGVKYTYSYLKELYEGLPYRQSLWGIKTILKMYRVKSEGVKFEDKNEIQEQATPFIAITNEGIAVILNLDSEKVSYAVSDGVKKDCSLQSFLDIWDGIALLPCEKQELEEWHMDEHKKDLISKYIRRTMLWGFLSMLAIATAVRIFSVRYYWSMLSMVLLCSIGLTLSILLLKEQVFEENVMSKKICGMVSNGNCKSIIHSDASKILGTISWSEIGFSFFSSFLLGSIFLDGMWGTLAFISLCALPYTIWSIGYQKFVAHIWCMLCVLVQFVIVCLALVFMIDGSYVLDLESMATFVLLFLAILLCCNRYMELYGKANSFFMCKNAYKKLKLSNGVFDILIKSEPELKESHDMETAIVFGNRQAKTRITIFGNLHCEPCAELHETLKWVENKDCCIRYYFSMLTSEYIKSAQKVIACYMQYGSEVCAEFIDKWYQSVLEGKGNVACDDLQLDTDNPSVIEEVEKHRMWMKENKMLPTPVVFINGRKLPMAYTAEDLIALI